jgi:hypothetical protein
VYSVSPETPTADTPPLAVVSEETDTHPPIGGRFNAKATSPKPLLAALPGVLDATDTVTLNEYSVPGVSTPGLMLSCRVVEGGDPVLEAGRDVTVPCKAELNVEASIKGDAVSTPPRVLVQENAYWTPEDRPPKAAVSTTRSSELTASEPRSKAEGIVRWTATDGMERACDTRTLVAAVREDQRRVTP